MRILLTRIVCGMSICLFSSQILWSQSFNSRLYPASFNNQFWKVWDVAQLPSGPVWVATEGGLAEFTGQKFIYEDQSKEWGAVYQFTILNDSSFFLLSEKGIYRLYFPNIHHPPIVEEISSGHYRATDNIFFDKHDKLWLSTSKGTFCYRASNYDVADKLSEERLLIAVRHEKTNWGVSENGKIFLLNSVESKPELVWQSKESLKIQSICAVDTEHLLLGGDALYEFTLRPNDTLASIRPISEDLGQIRQMILLGPNEVLLCSSFGVFTARKEKAKWVFEPIYNQLDQQTLDKLPFEGINSFAINNQRQVWVAAENGLGLMYKYFFERIKLLSHTGPWGIALVDSNQIYVNSGKTFQINRLGKVYQGGEYEVKKLGLKAATTHGSEGLWVSDLDSRLALIKPNGKQITWDLSYNGGILFSINQDPDGSLWACQAPAQKPLKGIVRIFPEGDVVYYGENKGLDARLLYTQYCPDGNMYASGIGPNSYLYRFDEQQDTFINLSLPLPFAAAYGFEVHQFAMDKEQNIWMASTDGLLKYEGDTVKHIKIGDWPLDQEVRSILLTDDDALWIGSNQLGLTYYKGDTIVHLGEESGLPVGEMVYRVLDVDQSGYIWAGTGEGLVVSRYPFPKPFPLPAPKADKIRINDFSLAFQASEVPEIPYLAEVGVSFSSFSFPTNEIQYQGRVSGANTPWIDLVPEQEWVLPALSAGNHSLEIRARNTNGSAWSEAAVYEIMVKEIWYKSTWAIILYIALGSGLILLGLSIRNRRLQEANKHLEELVQERTEKLANALEVKSNFMANMSHEIRTPMHGVIATLDLLADTSLSTEQKDYVGIVRNSSQLLVSIINDILDLSKIESGKMELESIPFSLRDCVEQVLLTFASKAAAKSLELTYEIAPDVPPKFVGDEIRITQILSNLVNNSIKFTHQGGVHFNISRKPDDKLNGIDAEIIRIQVIDTGIGIPAEKQAQLFEAFSQADSSITRKYGGTGLGLTIVKHLINLMNGRISVDSEEGKGTSFSIMLPLSVESQDPEIIDKNSLEGKQVLMIAQASRSRDCLINQLKQWGMDIQVGESIAHAKVETPEDHADYIIFISSMDKDSLSNEYPFTNYKVPVLLISPINEVRSLSANKPEWIRDIMPMPIRHQNLYDWLSQGKGIEASEERVSVEKPLSNNEMVYPIRILLAEDNLVNKKLAIKILEKIGYEDVDWVENGKLAYEAVQKNDYDLVFMDINMPEMDGLTATGIIRSEISENKQPVIIALTASALKADVLACIEAGMNDFLSKPFRQSELKELLNKWGKVICQTV